MDTKILHFSSIHQTSWSSPFPPLDVAGVDELPGCGWPLLLEFELFWAFVEDGDEKSLLLLLLLFKLLLLLFGADELGFPFPAKKDR